MSDLREEIEIVNAKLDLDAFELAEAAKVLRELVDSLPPCSAHFDRPATRAYKRGGPRYCDECGTRGYEDVPEYPRAGPLRKAMALLARMEKR